MYPVRMKRLNRIAFAALSLALVLGASHRVLADAELRLYESGNDWDLKDRVVIRSADGAAFDYQYQKVCSAYSGCKSVRSNSDQDAQIASLGAADLGQLNDSIGKIADGGTPVSASPAKPSLCRQFRRIEYAVTNGAGKAIQVERFGAGCAGTRLPDANAPTIERLVNIAATSAGF